MTTIKSKKFIKNLESNMAKDEAILESIGEGLIAIDKDKKVTLLNRAAEKMLGIKEEKIINKVFTNLISIKSIHGTRINKDSRPMEIALKTGKKTTGKYYYKRIDNKEFPVSVTVTPIKLKHKTIGAIEVFRDISVEEEIDLRKTEFISLASHQLRTPLSAMKWYLEMLMAGDVGKLNKEQAEFVKTVHQSNERTISMVNSLLNISRVESGRIIIYPVPASLNEIIKNVITDVKSTISKKKIKLIISIHKNLPPIKLDKKLIHNVYLNLLTNAIKYTPKGGEISIIVSRKEANIITQVSDNGYGISKNQQNRVFEKFFRADNIIKLETDGTGLGLYLVKIIIDSSGGKIWFKSTEGKGTSFWFSLPIKGVKPKHGAVVLQDQKFNFAN